MLIVTTMDGKNYSIKLTDRYKNAKDLIGLLTNKTSIQLNYVVSIHDTYILAKYIIAAQDA